MGSTDVSLRLVDDSFQLLRLDVGGRVFHALVVHGCAGWNPLPIGDGHGNAAYQISGKGCSFDGDTG